MTASRFLHQPCWKQYADFLTMGLTLSVCTVNDAVLWVDQLIERSELPVGWMIEISVSTTDYTDKVKSLLALVPGEANVDESFRLLIAKIGELYPTLLRDGERFFQRQHSRLIIALYHFAREQTGLSESIYNCVSQLYFDMDYVEEGHGDWTIIQQDYAELLALRESAFNFV